MVLLHPSDHAYEITPGIRQIYQMIARQNTLLRVGRGSFSHAHAPSLVIRAGKPSPFPVTIMDSQLQSSNALWAHLLPKTSLQLSVPPRNSTILNGPFDKNGTSMRILLHDTQTNLEKFSEKVDRLARGVEEAKFEVMEVKALFQGDQERQTRELVETVDRCQSEIQKSVGSPAQAKSLHQDVQLLDRRLESIEKQVDSLHKLYHNQTESFQTYAKSLQAIQEHQVQILAAVMPLLPHVQAIPLCIDSIKNSLFEKTVKTFNFGLDDEGSPVKKRKRMDFTAFPEKSVSPPREAERNERVQPEIDAPLPAPESSDVPSECGAELLGVRQPDPPISKEMVDVVTRRTALHTSQCAARAPLAEISIHDNRVSTQAPKRTADSERADTPRRASLHQTRSATNNSASGQSFQKSTDPPLSRRSSQMLQDNPATPSINHVDNSAAQPFKMGAGSRQKENDSTKISHPSPESNYRSPLTLPIRRTSLWATSTQNLAAEAPDGSLTDRSMFTKPGVPPYGSMAPPLRTRTLRAQPQNTNTEPPKKVMRIKDRQPTRTTEKRSITLVEDDEDV